MPESAPASAEEPALPKEEGQPKMEEEEKAKGQPGEDEPLAEQLVEEEQPQGLPAE